MAHTMVMSILGFCVKIILNLQSWLERTYHYQEKEEEDQGHIVQGSCCTKQFKTKRWKYDINYGYR